MWLIAFELFLGKMVVYSIMFFLYSLLACIESWFCCGSFMGTLRVLLCVLSFIFFLPCIFASSMSSFFSFFLIFLFFFPFLFTFQDLEAS